MTARASRSGLFVIALLMGGCASLSPEVVKDHHDSCARNLRKVSRSLVKHLDEGKPMPKKLEEVGALPKCPSTQTDTFSAGYKPNEKGFVIACTSPEHARYKAEVPAIQITFPEGFGKNKSFQVAPQIIASRSTSVLGCSQNLLNIYTATQDFKKDHQGKAPQKFSDLVPAYLPTIPICPAAGSNTYDSGTGFDGYMICSGRNHNSDGVESNMPRLDSGKVTYEYDN